VFVEISCTYYNIVADFLGRRQEERSVEAGTTIAAVVRALAAESESFGRLALTGSGEISGHLRLFRNDQAVIDLDEPLADGDEIRMFPAISGG
jgi:molybdopterin converting factor small subunit